MKLSRETKYSKELLAALTTRQHATNADLLLDLQALFPEVSATTVHRVSSRLLEQGRVLEAPKDTHGAMRYDAVMTPHDHFICQLCGGIRNIDVATDVLPTISLALGGCKVTGRLVIYGSCETCLDKQAIVPA